MVTKIYNPVKNPMQSGKGKSDSWLLEFDRKDARYIDPVMGWTGSSNAKQQLRLEFNSKGDAIAYAKRKNIEYQLVEPETSTYNLRAYSDNFTN